MPTTRTMPINPIKIPRSRLRCHTVLSPCIEAISVAQIGTVATNNPAKPELIFSSAAVIKNQGPTISPSAYGIT